MNVERQSLILGDSGKNLPSAICAPLIQLTEQAKLGLTT